MTKGKSIEEIRLDDSAEYSKKISEEHVREFKEITDNEPRAHGISGMATAPEMLCAGLISAVL
jgi:hypothetical protein